MKLLEKFKTILVCSFLSFLVLSFPVYGEESLSGVIIADNVNLRENFDLTSDVIGSLDSGENVEIIDTKNNWYQIKTNLGCFGWVFNDLVLPLKPSLDPIKKGIVTADTLNLREQPNTNSNIIFNLFKNMEVNIVETQDDWFYVFVDQLTKGWIYSSYVNIKPNYSKGKLVGDNVNLRTESNNNSSSIANLSMNALVNITGFEHDWYKVETLDNNQGFIHKSSIQIIVNDSKETVASRSSNRVSLKIKEYAKSNLNKPYLYGANGPSSFDCSGFTSYVFKHFDIDIPRTSKSQSKAGVAVSKPDLQTGDLVFFDTSGINNGAINHVGIYIGGGQFIHASSGKNAKRVVISDITSGFYNKQYVKARRV